MTVDWTRLLRGLGLLAWAAFFDYLWLSGKATDYVGPRTGWVVVFGAIALTAAALLYLSGVPARQRTPAPSGREVGRLLIIIAPILLAATAPAVTLGAQAVDQKRSADGATSLARLADYDGEIRLYELAGAAFNPEWAAERGIKAGLKVEFDGFVSRVRNDGSVELSRFMASCCAADAVPYSIDVVLPPDSVGAEKNQWLDVRGTVETGTRAAFMVAADSIQPIDTPLDAYG
jgi:uncharacterized repeat protein (TIGR03943 family)